MPRRANLARLIAATSALSLFGCELMLGPERVPDRGSSDPVAGSGGAGGVGGAGGIGGNGATGATTSAVTSSSTTTTAGSTGGMGGMGGAGGTPWTDAPACDPQGDVLWLRSMGDFGYDEPGSMASDGNGGVYLSGRFEGQIDLGAGLLTSAGSNDFYLAQLDSNGQAIWSKRYGTAGADELGPWISAHPQGFVIAGTNLSSLDFGGGAHAANGADAYIALMSPIGDLIWEHWLEGPDDQRVWGGAAVDPNTGDVYAGILFKGPYTIGGQPIVGDSEGDAMVIRLGATDGALQAHRHWGDDGQDHIRRLVTLADGSVVVSAYTTGVVDLGQGPLPSGAMSDVLLARLDPNLAPIWSHVFPTAYGSGGLGLLASQAGDIVFTGTIDDGAIDLGTGPISTPLGTPSGFVARVSITDGLATDAVILDGFNAPAWLVEASDGSLAVAGAYTYGISVGNVTKQSGNGGNSQADPVVLRLSSNLDTVSWVQFASESKKWEAFNGMVPSTGDTLIIGGYFHEQLAVAGCSPRTSAGFSDTIFIKRTLF